MCGTFYFWADNLLRTGDGLTIITEMTNVFQMAIRILKDSLYDHCNTFLELCGYELFDTLSKCFGGCYRCKLAMLEKSDFKYTPFEVSIHSYNQKSLQDALISSFLDVGGY